MRGIIQEMAIVLDMLDSADIAEDLKDVLIREAITLFAKFIKVEEFKVEDLKEIKV